MSVLKNFKKKNLTIDDLRTYIPEKGRYRYDPDVMVSAVNPETEEVITTEEYKNSPKKAFTARNQKKGFKLYNQYGQETRDLLPDGGILPESAAAKIEEHKQRKKALSELNSINARIADNREKAIEIKNEVINKGGDKEVLKSELIKAFPDKDDLATVASYFKETDENSDTDFSLSDDEIREMIDSVGKTAIEEKTKKILQGVGGGKKDNATKPTTSQPDTPTAQTTPKPSDTDELKKGGLGDGIPEVGSFYTPDVKEELNAIDKAMEKEQQTGHRFYSRIFSVPEWFPKGLDEFREKKKELTDKPVYDKKSGKYVRNTTGEMATAKAEQEMAEEVIDGLQRDVNRAKLKGSVSDPVLNKRSKEQYEKSVSVLNDINKQIDDIDKEYNDLSAIEYKGTDYDSLAKEQDRKERLSALRQQREEAKNKLSEQEDIVNKFKTQYETRGDATSNLIESQQETIDAIRNGDLKDANEAVDNLKEEYRAAKRKLIKENAGDIARNVWFIIDLVTTMNRNAARLMPQGKYSPNLGNFETPALFQDYAAQLQNIRDSYNEANKEAAVGKVKLGLERGSEANKAIGEYYKNLADKDKDIFDISIQTEKDRRAALIRIMENKETSRFDNELKKDYIQFYMNTHKNTQASLREMLNDIDAVNTFIRRPKILAGLDPNQQSNYWYYEQATSPNTKDAIFKEMVTDIYRRGKQENKSDNEIRNDLRSLLTDLIRNEVVTTNDTVKLKDYQTKLGYVDSTANTIQGVYDTLIGKPVETATNVVNAATNVVNAATNVVKAIP
jgi:hypothetical protein